MVIQLFSKNFQKKSVKSDPYCGNPLFPPAVFDKIQHIARRTRGQPQPERQKDQART